MKYVQSFSYQTSLFDSAYGLRLSLRCRPMNCHGLNNLCFIHEHDPIEIADTVISPDGHVRTAGLNLYRINFNTVTETFSQDCRNLNGMRRPLWDVAGVEPEQFSCVAWNDLFYYTQRYSIVGLYDQSLRWRNRKKLRGIRAICVADKSSTLVINENEGWFCESEGSRTLEVDDDFVVALSGTGYCVYNFGEFGLTDAPWVRKPEVSRWRRYTVEDTDCPVSGCGGAARSDDCEICGGGTNGYDPDDESELDESQRSQASREMSLNRH